MRKNKEAAEKKRERVDSYRRTVLQEFSADLAREKEHLKQGEIGPSQNTPVGASLRLEESQLSLNIESLSDFHQKSSGTPQSHGNEDVRDARVLGISSEGD